MKTSPQGLAPAAHDKNGVGSLLMGCKESGPTARQTPHNSGPTARPHCSLAQRARSPGKNASRAEGPKQAVGTKLVPGLQPGIAARRETYGDAIGYSVAAPLALNRGGSSLLFSQMDRPPSLSDACAGFFETGTPGGASHPKTAGDCRSPRRCRDSMHPFRELSPFACALAVAWAVCTAPDAQALSVDTDPASGIAIDVEPVFQTTPVFGATAVRVRIQNGSARAGEWRFSLGGPGYSGGIDSSFRLNVEAGNLRVFNLVVPTSTLNGGYLPLQSSGPGIIRERQGIGGGNALGSAQSGVVAISSELAARSFDALKKSYETAHVPISAMRFDPDLLSDDWRGYTGVEFLCLSQAEWNKLTPPVRSAIRQWVAYGGRLTVMALGAELERVNWAEFHLPSGETERPYGFGSVRAWEWDGKELDDKIKRQLVDERPFLDRPANPEAKTWQALAALGDLRTNGALVIVFVGILALALGPLNLYYLAPAGRRHRMFVTTPLLSVGGSLVLMAVILLQEGVGGTGQRFTMIHLLPDAHEALVLQEQASRTGLLLGTGFRLREDALLLPIAISGRSGNEKNYSVAGRDYVGDWFRNRSIQGQTVAAIRPSRASVVKTGTSASGAPIVISSVGNTLASLLYVDDNGKTWRGERIRTGEKAELGACAVGDAQSFMKGVCGSMREQTQRRFSGRGKRTSGCYRNGYFYATAAAADEPIPTLSSIRWNSDRVFYLGPVETGAAAPTTAAGGEKP